MDNKNSGIELIISEDDLDKIDINKIEALRNGKEILGDDKVKRILFDALPAIITKRIKKIIPEDFTLNEIEIKLLCSGTIFGAGISGEVTVKLNPQKT